MCRRLFVRAGVRFSIGKIMLGGMATSLEFRSLERVVRGFSCHRRIQILALLEQASEPMSMSGVAGACRANIKSISEHLRRLTNAGLVGKQSRGRETLHRLTPLGRKILMFLGTIS